MSLLSFSFSSFSLFSLSLSLYPCLALHEADHNVAKGRSVNMASRATDAHRSLRKRWTTVGERHNDGLDTRVRRKMLHFRKFESR